MVNVSELLINPVSRKMPKLLIGINQKVCGRITLSLVGLRRQSTAGEEAEPADDENPALEDDTEAGPEADQIGALS